MSLELKVNIVPTAYGLAFTDTTGTTSSTAYSQGGNIAYSSVTCVRIKFASYSTLTNVATLTSGTFTQYKEYINVGAAVTIDGKTMAAGVYFVPQTTGIAVSGTWEETGYYVYPHVWLPSSAQTPLDITVAEINETGTTVEDTIRLAEYEVYYPQQTPTQAAVSGTTYIVSGTGTVAYNSDTYRVGEVFTAVDTHNITTASGSPKINKLYASVSQYFSTTYNVTQNLYEIVLSTFGKDTKFNGDLPSDIILMRTQLEAVDNACQTNNVDITQAYDIIQYLSDKATLILDGID